MFITPILIDAGISAFESPAHSEEFQSLDLSIDELLINNRPNSVFIGRANGNSMTNVGIYHNDLLVIDRAEPVNHNNVIVCNLNGTFVCKILDKHNKALLSASPEHKAVYISETDVFQVEGVVTCSLRLHKPIRNFI